MHPYRVAEDPGDLPPLPLRSLLRATGAVAILPLVVASFVETALHTWQCRPPPPPSLRSFDVAELLDLDKESLAALHGQTVIIRGVVRERRHDSFLNEYVTLDRGLARGLPVVQCFLADGRTATPSPGTTVRFRALVLGMSLGVALQAEDCETVGKREEGHDVGVVYLTE